MNIRNIFCVGRNYRLHAEELGNAVPTEPFLFMKPTHALAWANGEPITLPADSGEVHYEAEFVIHIAQPYSKGKPLDEVIDRIALGIDFTLRDIQSELKKKGYPWLRAKGFKNSAVSTPFRDFPGLEACANVDFKLLKNGEQVQNGNIKDMIFDVETIIEYVDAQYGLSTGDVIYTGTPAGVGPAVHGDKFTLLWGEEVWGEFTVHMPPSGE